MNTQPEALRLAEISPYLENSERSSWNMMVCAELRRLHEVNAELVEALEYIIKGVPSTWVGVTKAQTVLEKVKGDSNG